MAGPSPRGLLRTTSLPVLGGNTKTTGVEIHRAAFTFTTRRIVNRWDQPNAPSVFTPYKDRRLTHFHSAHDEPFRPYRIVGRWGGEADLLFHYSAPATIDVGTKPTAAIQCVISASIAVSRPPTGEFAATFAPSAPATINARSPRLEFSASAEFDINVYRGVTRESRAPYQTAEQAQHAATLLHYSARNSRTRIASRYQGARYQGNGGTISGWIQAARARAGRRSTWGRGVPRGNEAWSLYQDGANIEHRRAAAWQGTGRVSDRADTPWITLDRNSRPRLADRWETAASGPRERRSSHWQPATRAPKRWCAPFEEATPLSNISPQVFTPIDVGGGDDKTGCYTPPAADQIIFNMLLGLDGRRADDIRLFFRCDSEPKWAETAIPVQEVYFVINNFSISVGGNPLLAQSFQASLDYQSWAWTWSAQIPAHQLPFVWAGGFGEPVEAQVTINGVNFVFLVESMRRSRKHLADWVTISGRSLSAWLAAPYAESVARAEPGIRTAQQLAGDALTVNGQPMGWAVDWGLTDWSVAADAWAHQGTHIEALARIAEAGGGYLQPHDTGQIIRVLPRYPEGPWNWSVLTPDFSIPDSVVEVEGIEWTKSPDFNAVYIEGGTGGRVDRVMRAGLGATKMAPTIVDALATDPAMTRQRGLARLGNTGRQALVTIRLPVMDGVGILRPGQLVDYTADGTSYRGLVRGTSVDVGHPDIWQSVKVETHE